VWLIRRNLLLTLFPEFQARHFRKNLPGGKLGLGTLVLVELFAGKYEQERRAKVKFGQVVDEQWIMLVGRVPTNRSKYSTQFVTENALFHINAMQGLRWSAQQCSLFVEFAKRSLRSFEAAGRIERNAGPID
jgi:hypothetical protein